ncbi:hypothetical protein D3C75_1244630 [compost metagenome]
MVGCSGDKLRSKWRTIFFCNTLTGAVTDAILLAEDRTNVSDPFVVPFRLVGLDAEMCEISRDHEVAMSTLE